MRCVMEVDPNATVVSSDIRTWDDNSLLKIFLPVLAVDAKLFEVLPAGHKFFTYLGVSSAETYSVKYVLYMLTPTVSLPMARSNWWRTSSVLCQRDSGVLTIPLMVIIIMAPCPSWPRIWCVYLCLSLANCLPIESTAVRSISPSVWRGGHTCLYLASHFLDQRWDRR